MAMARKAALRAPHPPTDTVATGTPGGICTLASRASQPFTSNLLTHVAADSYLASIPPQPSGSRIYYYLLAQTTNGVSATSPSQAPAALYSFAIVEAYTLLVSGQPLRVLVGHTKPVESVAFSPDGRVLASLDLHDERLTSSQPVWQSSRLKDGPHAVALTATDGLLVVDSMEATR